MQIKTKVGCRIELPVIFNHPGAIILIENCPRIIVWEEAIIQWGHCCVDSCLGGIYLGVFLSYVTLFNTFTAYSILTNSTFPVFNLSLLLNV